MFFKILQKSAQSVDFKGKMPVFGMISERSCKKTTSAPQTAFFDL
jgi:hypothetical protein